LTLSEHDVRIVQDERSALTAVDEFIPEVVVLDPMSKASGGEYLVRTIRRRVANARIVAIGSDDSEAAAVLALRIGADDYLGQPLRTLEFLARVDAHLRGLNQVPPALAQVEIRGVTIDRAARLVMKDGRVVSLAPSEYDILDLLFARAGAVVKREELQRALGNKLLSAASRAVDQHVMELRRKLEREPPSKPLIETVRRVGYRILRDRTFHG
jgi:DNA-binding response OmpR family regulator